MKLGNDAPKWYGVGTDWETLNLAVPAFGDSVYTLNQSIHYLALTMGKHLQAVMFSTDAQKTSAPSIDSLERIGKLCDRTRSILLSRGKAAGEPRLRVQHATPWRRPFIVYPCPFFTVRNYWLQNWGGLALMALTEAVQHSENADSYGFSKDFAALIWQFVKQIHFEMATELLMVPAADAAKDEYTIPETVYRAYEPLKVLASVEQMDVPVILNVPTEVDLKPISRGIPANELVGVQDWPIDAPGDSLGAAGDGAGTSGAGGATGSGSLFGTPAV